MGCIYKIWNDINDKVYVGKTCLSVEARFQHHKHDIFKRRNENRPLYAAMRKYGIDHFHVSELECCDDNLLEERENYWIKYFGSYGDGYNATCGGDGKSRFDHNLILEELIFCPYAGIVAGNVGCSVDLVRRIARRNGIKVVSPSQEYMKNVTVKRVMCDADTGCNIFNSVADAAAWLYSIGKAKTANSGVRSHISDCARGKRDTAYGYRWSYV